MLRGIVNEAIRGEMRKRVDEILKSGAEWCSASKSLEASVSALAKAITEGKVPPETLKPLEASVKNLAGKTTRLAKAFTKYNVTVEKIAKEL